MKSSHRVVWESGKINRGTRGEANQQEAEENLERVPVAGQVRHCGFGGPPFSAVIPGMVGIGSEAGAKEACFIIPLHA